MICPNCGSEQVGNFCAQCGQRFQTAHSMRAFAKAVADDQFGVDAKLPRTLSALFFKPGLLTSEFMNGRIVRYIPPVRLYLLASVLFFVLLSFLSRRSDWAERAAEEIQKGMADSLAQSGNAQPDTAGRRLNVAFRVGDKPWFKDESVNFPWQWLDQKIEANLKALSQLPPNVALRRATDAIIDELPKVMFLLLPVYALLLKLIYIRRRRYYIEHFVFALHVHAFAFIMFVLVLLFRADWVMPLVSLVIAVYTLLAMKRVYAQGYMKTTLKWLALGFVYAILLGLGVTLAVILALAAGTPT